jgi:hypothetical protein
MSHPTPRNKRGPCHTRNQSLIAIVYRTKSITNKGPNIQHRTKIKSLYRIACTVTGDQTELVTIILTSRVTSKNIVVQMSLLLTAIVAKQE